MSKGKAPSWPRNLQLIVPLPLLSICIRVTSCKQSQVSYGIPSSGIADDRPAMAVLPRQANSPGMMVMGLAGSLICQQSQGDSRGLQAMSCQPSSQAVTLICQAMAGSHHFGISDAVGDMQKPLMSLCPAESSVRVLHLALGDSVCS